MNALTAPKNRRIMRNLSRYSKQNRVREEVYKQGFKDMKASSNGAAAESQQEPPRTSRRSSQIVRSNFGKSLPDNEGHALAPPCVGIWSLPFYNAMLASIQPQAPWNPRRSRAQVSKPDALESALNELLKAIREFRKFTDQPLTLRGSEYAHAVQELNKAVDRAEGLVR